MKIITLYETAYTDGYNHFGDANFFLDESIAKASTRMKYKGYAVDPIKHSAVMISKDTFLLLKSPDPVYLAGSELEKLRIRENALSKLSKEEKEILGLKEGTN